MIMKMVVGTQTVEIGPNGGPTFEVPTEVNVAIRDTDTYDIDVRLQWSARESKLVATQATFTSTSDVEPVSVSRIARISVRDAMQTDLELEVLGVNSWQGIVKDNEGFDPVAIDALIYLLAIAVNSPHPSATVATARGLAPSSGPKRVSEARKRGLIPQTQPGKASASTD
ncbi:MAG: hypothetical protein P8N13_01100 [Ilumatobacter sp.]|nr:hypothetical protein [Ilumatobacter sp.]